MIRIRNESDFRNWFKENYKRLGFSEIIKEETKGFPDFIMLEDCKKVKVELEIKSSNFILHKHPIKGVDKVICVNNDVELGIPTISLDNFKIIDFDKNSSYSIKSHIYKLIKKEKIMTSIEVAKKLRLNWNTADKYLLELTLDGKIQRIKKQGVNLWLLK